MQRSLVVLLSVVGLTAVACGSSAKSGDSAKATTTTQPAPTTVSTATVPGGVAFTSQNFTVPLTMTVDPTLASPPETETANFITWSAKGSDDAVRIMVPVELYKPGSLTPQVPPVDYAGYLRGLNKDGARITDTKNITIDGHPAQLMTVGSTSDLDGALGCPKKGADQADGCFGPQTDLVLRLAVVDINDKPTLIWARTSGATPNDRFISKFETMLNTLHFRAD